MSPKDFISTNEENNEWLANEFKKKNNSNDPCDGHLPWYFHIVQLLTDMKASRLK